MILYYQPKNGDDIKLAQVKKIAQESGQIFKTITEAHLSCRLADLLAEDLVGEPISLPENAQEPFLILDIPDEELDLFLARLREENLRFPYKARTTPSNLDWTLAELMQHVSGEAALMQALHQLYQFVQVSEEFEEAHYDAEKWADFIQVREEAKALLNRMGKEEILLLDVVKMTDRFNDTVLTLIGRE